LNAREQAIENCFHSWITRDVTAFCDSFAEDAVYIESWGPAYKNRGQIMTWFNDWNKENRVLQWDIHEYFHDRDKCICEWYFKCECSGIISGFDGVSIIAFDKADKIKQIKEYQSKTPNYYPYE